jgi:Protein of unknown function (DUF1566)
MQQNMPKRGTVLMVAVISAWVGVWVPPAFAKKAPVEVTGQTTSLADGDDGDIQAGAPFPSPRFRDQSDGTVEDNLTGLIWLKDAQCLGAHYWVPALAAVDDLNAGTDFSCADYTAGMFTDWRLPNIKELQSLIHFGFFSPALSNAAGTAKWMEGDAFSDVRSATAYWSSTSDAGFPTIRAWGILLSSGVIFDFDKDDQIDKDAPLLLVWPVRGGK